MLKVCWWGFYCMLLLVIDIYVLFMGLRFVFFFVRVEGFNRRLFFFFGRFFLIVRCFVFISKIDFVYGD